MATPRKTTRGKTKTARSRTASSKAGSTKARSAKVSTKVTAVKAVANQGKAVQAGRFSWLTINRLLVGATAVYAVLAVAVVFLMEKVAPPVTLTHLTNDPLTSQDGTIFVSASRELFNLDLRWALVALLLMSMVLPVLYLTRLKAYYADRVANRRVIPTRWLDLAVSSALMVEVIALLIGQTDLMMLKMMGASLLVTCALGWLAERQNEAANRPVWSAYTIGVITGISPWVVIGVTKLATLFYGGVRSPWYVYVVCISTVLGFVAIAVNQCLQHRQHKSWANYAIVERNYLLAATLTKVAFVLILLVGLYK